MTFGLQQMNVIILVFVMLSLIPPELQSEQKEENSSMSNELSVSNQNKSLVNLFAENPIINDADVNALIASKEFIVDTYLSVPMYRSLPIKLFGVLSNGDFPTPESKLWQCKAEAEVHAKELMRDLHDLEELKINIEKSEFIYDAVMKPKFDTSEGVSQKEVEFDMRKLSVSISRQKFEFMQLQKRIKYRIEEVDEWRRISEKLTSSFNLTNLNYANMLTEALRLKWTNELKNPKVTEQEKLSLQARLEALQNSLTLKSNNSDTDTSGVGHN